MVSRLIVVVHILKVQDASRPILQPCMSCTVIAFEFPYGVFVVWHPLRIVAQFPVPRRLPTFHGRKSAPPVPISPATQYIRTDAN